MTSAFGPWLKARRKELGLTQKELAQRVGCSAVMVEKIESGERRPSEQIAELLAGLFKVPAGEQRAFVTFARGALQDGAGAFAGAAEHQEAPWRALRRPQTLPAQHTPFIGREEVVAQVCELLRDPGVRLLTLTGPPGIGKTRLSLEVAANLYDDFADGVYFVPLAPVRDPGFVIPAVAQALGLRETSSRSLADTVSSYLSERQVLLVFDNFEQVTQGAVTVSELLSAAPQLKALASSRALLHLYGEYDFAVPAMSLPDLQASVPSPGRLAQYEAVRLFIERARSARRDFAGAGSDLLAVAQICAQLDGLPLAIELAAARIRSFTPQEILSRLANRLALLTGGPVDLPPRQRTLRGAIDWSYELLDDDEKTLFRRLAVFIGGFTLDAARAVSDEPGTGTQQVQAPVSDVIASLVDKSLLRNEGPGAEDTSRFSMLETIREYACEQLVESDEAEEMQRRHTAYYLTMAEEAQPQLKGAGQMEWLARLETEHGNMRSALSWSVSQGDAAAALRLGASLWRFWLTHGHLSEGISWLTTALAQLRSPGALEEPDVPQSIVAQALNGAGSLSWSRGDYTGALDFYRRALAIFRELGDKTGMSRALNNLAVVAHDQGNLALSRELYGKTLPLKQELGDKWGLAAALNGMGVVEQDQGNYQEARHIMVQALAMWRELGDKPGVASSLNNLGILSLMQGNYPAAEQLYGESLKIRRELGDRQGIAGSLNNLGEVAWCQGRYGAADAMFRESLELRRELGDNHGMASSMRNLGHAAHRQGQLRRAEEMYKEGLLLFNRLGDQPGVAECLAGLAGVAGTMGQARRAATLYGAASAILEATGFHLHPADRIAYDRDAPHVREMLGADAWEEACELGRAMTLERAAAFALGG